MGERSDKKEQTKPYVSIVVLEIVSDVRRYIGSKSNGETARKIVLASFNDWTILRNLQRFLRWDYHRGDHTFVGHSDHSDITSILPDQWSRTHRLPIRFTRSDIETMEILYSCLSCPWAHMVGALLRLGVESERVLSVAAPGYVPKSKYSLRRGVWS